MGQKTDVWLARAGKYLATKGSSYGKPEKRKRSSDTMPAVGGDDGVFFGIINYDLEVIERDAGCNAAMAQGGYDTEQNCLDQMRFARPTMYKALKDCVLAVAATKEPVMQFVVDDAITQDVYLLKMAPIANDEVMWVCIDILKSSSAVLNNWQDEVAEVLDSVRAIV